ALHHEPYTPESRDVLYGVSIDDEEIREQTALHLTDLRLHVQHARGDGGRALQRVGCRHTVGDHQFQLSRVVAVREHADVAAAGDRHAGVERGLEALALVRDR